MEFPFNVNDILSEEITLIGRKHLLQSTATGAHRIGYNHQQYATQNQQNHSVRHNLCKIIDDIGANSSQAQKLKGPITTSFKLKSSDDHLYILKEEQTNNGLGTVVGIIRVGMKRLFLTDVYGQQHECQPLCVLDFYVHESKQRSGYGKRLFDHVIMAENVEAHELAIDRPSPKFVNFLSKHYGLKQPIHQVNKFVVFERFFDDLEAIGAVDANRRRSAPANRKNLKKQLMRPDSRKANSASIRSNRQSEKLVSNALNDLASVPLVKQSSTSSVDNNLHKNVANYSVNNFDQPDDQRSLLGDRNLNARPEGSYAQRRPTAVGEKSSRLRNFSRHSISQSTIRSATVTRNQPPPKVSLDTRNHLTSRNYTITHSRAPQQGRNITSVDNPFASTSPMESTTTTNQNPDDVSYTMELLGQLNANRQTLGTSWNVFGVPRGQGHPANPYSKLQRRGFP